MRGQRGPLVREDARTGDHGGMDRGGVGTGVQDLAHRRRVAEPGPEPGHDEPVEVRRRKAPAGAVGSLALGDEVAGAFEGNPPRSETLDVGVT